MLTDSERSMLELNNQMVEAEENEIKIKHKLLARSKVLTWLADKIIDILALGISLIALFRTF